MVVDTAEETCNYMITRAKTCLSQGDASYAKCWILTANSLFPKNDQIKFEAYNMCKCEGNVEEASKYFCEIFNSGSSDKLIDEMKLMVNSCKSEWQTHNTSDHSSRILHNKSVPFYSKLFLSLSPTLQHELLLKVCQHTDNIMTLVDLMLFILKKFPSKISLHGVRLIEIMEEAEKVDKTNYIRKKLVFDVLSMIFSSEAKQFLSEQQIIKLMKKSLSFYVEQAIRTESLETNQRENSDIVEDKIVEIFKLIGNKLDWSLIASDNEHSLELIFENINTFIDQHLYPGGDGSSSPIDLSSASTVKLDGDEKTNQQILYATTLLFLRCLCLYMKLSKNMVLIEQNVVSFGDSKIIIPASKKRKLQLADPEIVASNQELTKVFVIASKCLKILLENSVLKKEFNKLSEEINLEKCRGFRSFLIDSSIYKGEYRDALNSLLKKKSSNLKRNVQLVSISLMLHDCGSILKYSLDVIENLMQIYGANSNEKSEKMSPSGNSYRQLRLIPLCVDDVVRYIVEVIIFCLKDRVILSLKPSDIGIGHLLVLSQYNWPEHVELFYSCMSIIRNSAKTVNVQNPQKFVYHCFLNYIFIPDIIEEFMNLVNDDIIIDIKGTASLGSPLKATTKAVTRGVNKGVKEELKFALLNQMKNSKTYIPNDIFIEFINKEIKIFFQNLAK